LASTKEIGEIAEGLAQQYILKLGYKIKDTNWHFGHLELDIVATGWRPTGNRRSEIAQRNPV
jgi:Holliday junction resolvase-like predicted endonuclease